MGRCSQPTGHAATRAHGKQTQSQRTVGGDGDDVVDDVVDDDDGEHLKNKESKQ